MISRGILQQKCRNAIRRWLRSCAAQTSPLSPSPVVSLGNSSYIGFSSQPIVSRYAMASFSMVNDKLMDLNIPYSIKRSCFSSHALLDLPASGIVSIPLAQTGEGIAECELLKWFVKEGDQVEEFQPLCEVQSDKATIEITSRYKGTVSQIIYVPGDIVKVGETLLKMVVEESQGSNLTSNAPDDMKSMGAEVCDSSIQSSDLRNSNTGGVLATPAVRNLAKQYGVDINHILGTGQDGRVLKEDVLTHAVQKGLCKEPSSLSVNSVEHFQGEEKYSHTLAADGWQYEDKTVPIRGFQRAMIKSMTLAAKIPHFHYVEEINCDALVKLKASFQEENRDPEVKHTFLPFMIKTLSMALSKYPLLNSCFNEELQEITVKGSHNIGIAMATPHGLVVPNIKRVQSLSILEITKELARLQQLALANNLCPEDISGGTITLSNIGAIGGKFGSPLLNPPEVSIIAIGRLQKVPQFVDDENMYPASIMTVNIGADHRVLDGATVARFCNEWKLYIEKPEQLMLHMK